MTSSAKSFFLVADLFGETCGAFAMLLRCSLTNLLLLLLNTSTAIGAPCQFRNQDIELCENPSMRSRPPELPDKRIVCPYRLPPLNTFKFGTYGNLIADDSSVQYNTLLELCASVSQTNKQTYTQYHPQETFDGRCDPETRRTVWTNLMDADTFHKAYFYELIYLSKVHPPWGAEALPDETVRAMSNLAWQQRRNTLIYCQSHCYCFDAWVELNKAGLDKGLPQFPMALRNAMRKRMRANLP